MCIGVPYIITKIEGNIAYVKLEDGSETPVDISLVEVEVGDYVMVQNGYATDHVSKEEAEESIRLFNEINAFYAKEQEEQP